MFQSENKKTENGFTGFVGFVSLYLKWIEEYRERIERLKKMDEKPLKMNASVFYFTSSFSF